MKSTYDFQLTSLALKHCPLPRMQFLSDVEKWDKGITLVPLQCLCCMLVHHCLNKRGNICEIKNRKMLIDCNIKERRRRIKYEQLHLISHQHFIIIPITDFTLPLGFVMPNIYRKYHHQVKYLWLHQQQGVPLLSTQRPHLHNFHFVMTLHTLEWKESGNTNNSGGAPPTKQKSNTKKTVGWAPGPEAKTTKLIQYFNHMVFVRS